jgi:CHAT domain-containing protein/Tfp pilus assembly protein PilF
MVTLVSSIGMGLLSLSPPLQATQPARLDGARCPRVVGLVVEAVEPHSVGERVGLLAGDVLKAWCRPGPSNSCSESGKLTSVVQWWDLEMIEIQRGGLRLDGRRAGESLTWQLLPSIQGLTLNPVLETVDFQDSAATDCPELALWWALREAQLASRNGDQESAETHFRNAFAAASRLADFRPRVQVGFEWARALLRWGNLAEAQNAFQEVLETEETRRPGQLGVARALNWLGDLASRRAQPTIAEEFFRRAAEIARSQAPDSGAAATSALNLASSRWQAGDLAAAEAHSSRALEIRTKLTPEGAGIAAVLLTQGNILFARGELGGAEGAFDHAREVLEQTAPNSSSLPKVLHNLGVLASLRNDREAAENLFERELDFYRRLDPLGPHLREALLGLAELALRRRDGARAESLLRRSLALAEARRIEDTKTAWTLRSLANAVRLLGRGSEARGLLERALKIARRISPGSLEEASCHLHLGILATEEARYDSANESLAVARRVTEDRQSPLAVDALHASARLAARRGRSLETARWLARAIEVLEENTSSKLGAENDPWLGSSDSQDLYAEASDAALTSGELESAWEWAERGRARSYRELLNQRDLRFELELSADQYRERRRLAAQYEATQAELATAGGQDLLRLRGRLVDLRTARAQLDRTLASASSRMPQLAAHAPVGLEAVRAALPSRSALLGFSVGIDRTWLFVLPREGPLEVFPIALGRKDLLTRIVALRAVLRETSPAGSRARGKELYDLLLAPAEGSLREVDHLILMEEGSLQFLPLAALHTGRGWLTETWSHHWVPSASIYAEGRGQATNPNDLPELPLVALGDPRYAPATHLRSLPASRREVEALAQLVPGARTLVGTEAREEAVFEWGPRARWLHLAAHGLLDSRRPLDSALILASPTPEAKDGYNGRLQAWEVFETLRLEAELVTLSACDAGVSSTGQPDGLSGLVRAFQFAGARAVLAPVTSVSDLATAALMTRFYRHLVAGAAPSRALRAAQVEMIRLGNETEAHPYSWAAFQLYGSER